MRAHKRLPLCTFFIVCSRRLAVRRGATGLPWAWCPPLQLASSSPAPRARRCGLNDIIDQFTVGTSCSVPDPRVLFVRAWPVYLLCGGGAAVPPMARSLCTSRKVYDGCYHFQRPPIFCRLLLILAMCRNRRTESNEPPPGSPCPLYEKIFHAATIDRMADEGMRSWQDQSCL